MVDQLSSALSAYQTAVNRAVSPSEEPEIASPAGSFASMVRASAEQVEKDNQYAELMSMKAIKGTADIQEVVMAVSNAEVALQTVVAVRDKVVSAYQEIMQMPI